MIGMELLHNTTSAPVVFDAPGHSVDGYGNAQGNTSDPVTRDLLAAGVLLVVPEPAEKAAPKSKTGKDA